MENMHLEGNAGRGEVPTSRCSTEMKVSKFEREMEKAMFST